MDLSPRLARQQVGHAAAMTALRAVRERLRGQRISARTDRGQPGRCFRD